MFAVGFGVVHGKITPFSFINFDVVCFWGNTPFEFGFFCVRAPARCPLL